MAFGLDDDDRDSANSSDNDQDELMEDADDGDVNADVEQDQDEDGDEDENDDDNGEDNDDDEDDTQSSPRKSLAQRPSLPDTASEDSISSRRPYINGAGPTSHPRVIRTSASPRQTSVEAMTKRLYPTVRPEALNASIYDIVPTMAAPQSTSINAVTATPDMRFWFTGGSDCYVRKYDGAATINGKTLLTVAQRHPFVDSVTKAGVLMSYWENEETKTKSPNEEPSLSQVYSLAVQRDALWLLSGLESGSINLQSVRHDEGKRIACLDQHSSAVSVLTLAADEKSVLSGSWDKNILDWDLNTGKVRRDFKGSSGQISAINIRPASSLPVPEESGEIAVPNGTFASNNEDKPASNGAFSNGANGHSTTLGDGGDDAPGDADDGDSLFGGGGDADSLFGDNDGGGGGFGGGDDDDGFSHAMDDSNHLGELQDTSMLDAPPPVAGEVEPDTTLPTKAEEPSQENGSPQDAPAITNGAIEPDLSLPERPPTPTAPITQDPTATSDTTFLAASFDGTIQIWDRRVPNPIARIPSRTGGPWCMDACWSPDGNHIYAGRRNNTVEEFSLHKGFKGGEASRVFKFPGGSGPVSAVKAMPNGRHLICASYDILRLYDLKEQSTIKHSTVPFLIVPGPPRAGMISALYIDATCKYMLSAAGNRGWEGSNTEVLIGYEIGVP